MEPVIATSDALRSVESIPPIWPLAAYFGATLLIVGVILTLSHFLGQKRRNPATIEPFESGIVSVGTARYRVPIPFYLLAIFFVIFDLEAVFLFAWAIAFREAGWPGYIEAMIFIGILGATLAYLWKLGALDWRTQRQKEQQSNYKR